MPPPHRAAPPAALLTATLAAAAPSLLAWNVSPSPTFLNQALALGLWGVFAALASAPASASASASGAAGSTLAGAGAGAGAGRSAWPLHAALALVALNVAWTWGPGALPMGLALSALGLLAGAAVLVAAGSAAGAQPAARAVAAFEVFCIGWAVAGACNVAIAAVQVFAPDWPDGDWIAVSAIAGRAVGNLRQPNHLSSLLLWSAIAVVTLGALGRLRWRWGAPLFVAMIFAVVLTASRTGGVSVALLALWGLADRRLARPGRALLLAAPLLYGAAFLALAQWARLAQGAFGGAARLAEGDVSGSRFGIWRNTLEMIRQQPWTGTGFGEFNLAWTLTPFPGRPVALFDHAHNLPLHLAAELGLPLAGAVMLLLLLALWRAARVGRWRATGAAARPLDPASAAQAVRSAGIGHPADRDAERHDVARRAAGVMVLMIGLHSLLEYPLWYAYFLLPAAWAWAFALAPSGAWPSPSPSSSPDRAGSAGAGAQRGAAPPRALRAAGALVGVAALASVLDYRPVTEIFAASAGAPPLVDRITRGQRSVLFAHHADYAAATTALDDAPASAPPAPAASGGTEGAHAGAAAAARAALQPFDRAAHYLLDTRLLAAWARDLHRAGLTEHARYVADRLREFRHPSSQAFFADCPGDQAPPRAAAPGRPFQCQRSSLAPDWRAFTRPPVTASR